MAVAVAFSPSNTGAKLHQSVTITGTGSRHHGATPLSSRSSRSVAQSSPSPQTVRARSPARSSRTCAGAITRHVSVNGVHSRLSQPPFVQRQRERRLMAKCNECRSGDTLPCSRRQRVLPELRSHRPPRPSPGDSPCRRRGASNALPRRVDGSSPVSPPGRCPLPAPHSPRRSTPAGRAQRRRRVNVTAIGGTTPNLTLSVQWSNDAHNWYTADPADTFTAITAVGKVVKSFASKGKFLRLNEVFTGTGPSATYSAEAWTL
jgi:hypothetical protein